MRVITFLLALAISGVFLFVGCVAFLAFVWPDIESERQDTTYSPTGAELLGRFSDFIVEPRVLFPEFAESEHKSCVFRYESDASSPNDFWETIATASAGDSWSIVHTSANQRRFQRTVPGADPSQFVLEEIRVAYEPASRSAVVAYARAVSHSKPASLDDSVEGKWAKVRIWPLFESMTAGNPWKFRAQRPDQ